MLQDPRGSVTESGWGESHLNRLQFNADLKLIYSSFLQIVPTRMTR